MLHYCAYIWIQNRRKLIKSCLESFCFHVCSWRLLCLQKGKSSGLRGNSIIRALGKKKSARVMYSTYLKKRKVKKKDYVCRMQEKEVILGTIKHACCIFSLRLWPWVNISNYILLQLMDSWDYSWALSTNYSWCLQKPPNTLPLCLHTISVLVL